MTVAPAHNATPPRAAAALRWIGLIVVLAIAVMRMVTAFSYTLVFDVDPAFDPNRFAGLASAGNLWLNALLLGGAGCALLGQWLSKRRIDWLLMVLAIAPMFIVFAHGFRDLGDLRDGATWTSAAIAGATIAHLGRDRTARIVIIMVLAGCIAPLLVRGAANVTYEHAEMQQAYAQQRELILADKGWDPDSSSARIYERRLKQRQPTGWFITTNIYGSFMAAGLTLWIGLCIASWRGKLQSGWTGLCVLIAFSCGVGLVLTESKGALLAGATGIGVLGLLVLLMTRGRSDSWMNLKRLGPILAIGLVCAALLGIAVRGALLPETFLGEVSLLYRWHYIVAALRIFLEHPLMGVGPDEFQAAYMIHRAATNPEEVASAHSMFFDWMATLGIVALAWIALVLLLLRRGGRRVGEDDSDDDVNAPPLVMKLIFASIGAITVLAFIPAMLIERPILDELVLAVRISGMLAFIIAALIAGHIAAQSRSRVVHIALLASAVALVVHGQIEMTWTQPGSAAIVFVFLGAAAPCVARSGRSHMVALPIVTIAGGLWLAFSGAIPATRYDTKLVAAARQLWPVARARQAQRMLLADPDSPHAALYTQQRNDALDELGVGPVGSIATMNDLEQMLEPVLRQRRRATADLLEATYHDWPITETPLYHASRQLGLASESMRFEQRVTTLKRATALAEQSAEAHRDIAAASDAMLMRLKLHELTGEQAHMKRAIELAEYLTEADPKGVRSHVSLGDVLWRDGQMAAAAQAYRRALEHSDNFALDPLKQLSDEDRRRLEARISEVESEQKALP